MKKYLTCKKHKYISKMIGKTAEPSDLPLECKICGKIYFTEKPLSFRTVSNKTVSVCSACRKKIRCAACKKSFSLKNFYLAECVKCGELGFFCKKCAKKTIILPTASDSKKKALSKMHVILRQFIHSLDRLPKNIKDLKKMKGFSNMPSYLLLHFNIILPDVFGGFEDKDGADWWKK